MKEKGSKMKKQRKNESKEDSKRSRKINTERTLEIT